MSIGTQSVLFNALPLLVLASAYLVVAAALVPLVWRDRSVAHPLDIATVAVFPAVSLVSAVLGALVLRDREPVGGHIWITFVAVCIALVPPLLFFVRWRDRALVATGIRRAQAAEQLVSLRDREMEALAAISTALARARDLETAARPLVQQVQELLGVELAGVTLVNEDVTQATGVLAQVEGEDVDWFRELRLDLRNEPSGIASAVFEVAPIIAYDCKASPNINQRLVELVGAESGIWVPIVAEHRVVGVLIAVTTTAKRVFTPDEIALMQALAGETALALDRMSSAAALADALEREQRIAAIARRVRGELSTDEVIRVVTEELRSALSLEHVAVELGDEEADGIPIRAGLSRVGTITFERAEPLVDGERLLVEAVVREVGLALQTARLVAEKQRRLAQQSALLQAVQVVSSELELEVVLERLVEEVAKLLEADAADCYLLDTERGVLRCAAVHGLDAGLVGLEIGPEQGVSGLALERERPILVSERAELDRTVPHVAYRGFSQVLVAPMVWGGEPRGVLGVGNRQGGRAFDRADTDLLETFAGLGSVAIRNAESLGELRDQARVQRAFFRIASLLSETLSLAETYNVAAQAAAEALGGDFGAVLTAEDGELGVAGAHELPAEVRGLPSADTLLQAALDGSTIASSRIADDERFDAAWRRAPFSSLLATPVEGSSRGLVVVFFRSFHAWSGEDLEFARQVGRAARGALERSRLYETERTARALSQQLARTGTLLGRGLDPAAVLEEVVEQAVALLDADAGAVAALEGGELVIGAAHGHGVEEAIGQSAPSTGWLGGDVVQLHAPVAREEVSPDSALAEADPVLSLGHRAYLGVPLAARDGSVLGVLSVYGAEPRAWREDEREALAALAANASVALANAELYQRLALEHEQSVAILANVADGIVAVDRDGRVVAWNAAAEEITGVPAREAIGGTPLDVLQRELRSETGGANRLVPIMRGNEEVWLSLSETVMRDPAGAVAGRIFAFRDMSAERFAEQMRSEFVSTVSHELRAPLTSIYGFAATLLRSDIEFSESERETFLGYIASEAEQLTRIVDALLNVARLDSGELEVDLRPTDVRAALTEALPANGVAVEPNSHRFVLDLADDVPDVSADPDKLRQVLDQLIDNAVKYSPDGGVVRVEARWGTDAVEISVADEGVGIPASRLDRVFDKFFSGGESHPGTGLGLFIAQGLVNAMGGKIWVNSNEGRGSRFTFELPVAQRGEQHDG
jgi:PAS domain S-box-containing protein